jgi:hypothetical protein
MTLEASFQVLNLRFQALCDAVFSLHLTVGEDKPLSGEGALVDYVSNAVEDLLASLQAGESAARQGRQAVAYPTDLQTARHSLVVCQQNFNDLSYRLASDLLSYERLAELTAFGSERGGEWFPWSNALREALECCRQPAFDVTQALFLCWQEIAERTGVNGVSVNATNIGQMIEGSENKETIAAGVP